MCHCKATNDDVEDTCGRLTVDVACLTNGVTPKIKYGNIRFASGYESSLPGMGNRTNTVVTVMNWECLPKTRGWTTVLDLSETTVNAFYRNTSKYLVPDIVCPEDAEGKLVMRWEMNPSDATLPYKLLARRISAGTILKFK